MYIGLALLRRVGRGALEISSSLQKPHVSPGSLRNLATATAAVRSSEHLRSWVLQEEMKALATK